MPIQVRHPSYADCVATALSGSPRPLSLDELLEMIGAQRELGAGARSAVYRAINKLFQAVVVAPGVFGWISRILEGNVFRHELSLEETRRGYLLLDELEHIVFYPEFFQRYRPENRRITVDLLGGPTLHGEAAIEHKTWSLRLGPSLVRWIEQLGGQSGDDILVSVVDAFRGHYALRLQPHEIRDEATIRNRNLLLAALAEELVAEDRRTRPAIPPWELAAKLIGRGFFAHPLPVDDLHYVLHEFSSLRLVDGLGYQIDLESPTVSHAHRFAADSFFESGDRNEDQPMDHAFNDSRYNSDDDENEPEEDYQDGYSLRFNGAANEANEDNEDDCEMYAQYMQIFQEHSRNGEQLLSHDDFHLLEAELEMLVRLEYEFGRLLPEQDKRKLEIADQLFIDPNSLADIDWDMSDGEDYEDPPFWQN